MNNKDNFNMNSNMNANPNYNQAPNQNYNPNPNQMNYNPYQQPNVPYLPPKSKWVALLLCFFLGYLGVHKFYEGKIGMGVLYFFTFGLFGIGTLIDFIVLLFKPNPYYI